MTKILASFFLLLAFGCTTHHYYRDHHGMMTSNPPSGDINYGADQYTYQAEFKGKDKLKVGDKVRIMQYEFGDSLKRKQSANFPLESSRKQIGEATVSNVLGSNYYELKTSTPQPLPGNAFIEKL